jgi:hypothetical protein
MKRLQGMYVTCKDAFGRPIATEWRYEPTNFANFKYIVSNDEDNFVVGVLENAKSYLIGDRVKVGCDCRGYIAPGISQPGEGRITHIQRDDTDHFYGVQMDNGEFGFIKSARIVAIIS